MPSYSVSRLTLFAALWALEQDLRGILFDSLGSQLSIADLFSANEDLLARLQKRHLDDLDAPSETPTLQELLNYSDFADCNQLLQKHRGSLPGTIQTQLATIYETVEALAPIRNRVMHTRPLNYDDLDDARPRSRLG